MLRNRDKVLETLNAIRENAQDYFIPVGSHDEATEAKREISNLSGTLNARIPLVEAFVKAAAPHPVYVGYGGVGHEENLGGYADNIVRLSQAADDNSAIFIRAYTHELTHMDQDRRGLLRLHDSLPSPDNFVCFLAHYLMLEAASVASEATSLYFFSEDPFLENREKKTLSDDHPEIKGYFNDLLLDEPLSQIALNIMGVADGHAITDRDVFRSAWRSAFQAFFVPDSKLLQRYVNVYCGDYLEKASKKDQDFSSQKSWGGIEELKAITTMPGYGSMYAPEALDVLRRNIMGSVMQDKFTDVIGLTIKQGEKLDRYGDKAGLKILEAARRLS